MPSCTVLLVDDEHNLLQGLRRALHREPYDVLVATSATSALALLETRPVDVIVSDESMPGMSGTEFLRQVRSRYPETIRVILTGHANLKTAIRAINDGEVYRFLTKPCDTMDLALTIRQALERRRLLLEARLLLYTVRCQSAVIDDLEVTAKDITHVKCDARGAILLDDVPTDLDALLEEAQAEIDAA